MNEKLFRKKSLEKIKSPEILDDYIRVSNPGIIILLVSVILLLAGAFIWGAFGYLESKIPVNVLVEQGAGICYIEEKDAPLVKEGMTVRFENTEGVIAEMKEEQYWGHYALVEINSSIPNGNYDGEIILSRYRPITMIFN